jgi:hypothetical protein
MRIPVYVWQFDADYPGARADDTALPIAEAWVKTHFGSSWMAAAYTHPAAPAGVESVVHLARVYQAQGIGFVPWCEPAGRDVLGEVARACDVLEGLQRAGAPLRLVFDVEAESSPHFWKGSAADMRALVEGIRARFPDADLCLCHYQHDEIAFDRIADLFTSFSTMDYWNDFGTDPIARLTWSHQRLAPLGRPVIYGLPGSAPAGELARALAWVRDTGGGRAAIWRRGTTPAVNWDAIAAFDMEQVQLGLVRKVIDQDSQGLARDARKLAGVAE